jgi:hypothetical protein
MNNWLTLWSWVPFERPQAVQLLYIFMEIYGTPTFINAFTRTIQISLSCVRSIQSTSTHHISKRFILMLSIHLHLGLPSGLFPSGAPTNNLYTFLFSPIRAKCSTHLIFLDLIIVITPGEEVKSCSPSLCSFLQPYVNLSFLGSNNLLSTQFSNTLSLCSSFTLRDHVSHPYRTTGKIMVL